MERLRILRKNRGVSQRALAEMVGTSQQTISRLEKQETVIPTDLLVSLSDYFNVTTDYLSGVSEEKHNQNTHDRASYYMDKYESIVLAFDNLMPEYQDAVRAVIQTLDESQRKSK